MLVQYVDQPKLFMLIIVMKLKLCAGFSVGTVTVLWESLAKTQIGLSNWLNMPENAASGVI